MRSGGQIPRILPLTVAHAKQERPEWDNAKRLLNDTTIVKRLMEYEKDSMPDNMLKRLRRVTDHPEFTPEQVLPGPALKSDRCP